MRAGAGPPVHILGGDASALSVARSLGSRGIRVCYLHDGRASAATTWSRHVSTTLRLRRADPWRERWRERLLDSRTTRGVLFPASDEGLEFLASDRTELLEAGHHPIEMDPEAIETMLDKDRTYAAARAARVRSPRTRRVRTESEAREAAEAIGWPCALKPVRSHDFDRDVAAVTKGVVVSRPDDLLAAWRSVAGQDVLVTEVVRGPDAAYCSYYTYLDPAGRPLLHFTKRKPRQYPTGFGAGTFHETRWLEDVARLGLELFTAVGVRGIANVEFKRDPTGELTLIECNLRVTAADRLVQRAGVDLPWLAYRRALGDERAGRPAGPIPSQPTFREGLRMADPPADLRALAAYRRSGELRLGEWLASMRPPLTTPFLAADDPGPSLRRLLARSRELVARSKAALTDRRRRRSE